MPKTLTPNNIFPANIPNFPISGNDESIAIEPLEAAIQAVLDRTENLHQSRLVVEGPGVKRIQKVASLAALQSLAGMNDGDVVDVEGYGRYRLYNPSALAADGLWVLPATGGGRWVHTLNLMRGGNSGLATLTSGGRLAQDVRDASILTQHIANQAVTAAKLAPGSVVGHLGYTPLNKAGDTMLGVLTIQANLPQLLNLKGGTTDHVYMAFYARSADQNARSGYIGYPNSGSNRLTITNEIGEIVEINNTLLSRYDHQNRFVVSAFAGQDIAVSGNSFTVLGRIFVTVPSGRSLYVRRVRAYFTGDFRARVAAITGSVWVAGQAALDADINQSILTGPVSGLVYVGADNVSGSSQTVQQGHGAMIELEIR